MGEKVISETRWEGGAMKSTRGKAHAKRKITHGGTEGLSDVFKKQWNSYRSISQGEMMVAETTQTAGETTREFWKKTEAKTKCPHSFNFYPPQLPDSQAQAFNQPLCPAAIMSRVSLSSAPPDPDFLKTHCGQWVETCAPSPFHGAVVQRSRRAQHPTSGKPAAQTGAGAASPSHQAVPHPHLQEALSLPHGDFRERPAICSAQQTSQTHFLTTPTHMCTEQNKIILLNIRFKPTILKTKAI